MARAKKGRGQPEGDAASTIGELAEATGVTRETIRFYERVGVLPRPARTGAGDYRRYTRADTERVRFVRRARDLGFDLDEVRGLLALAAGDQARSCAEVNVVARLHLAQVDEKLARLTALRAELSRLIRSCTRDVVIANCTLLNALNGP